MKFNISDKAKEVYLLLGLLLFIFINVFLFDQKTGIGFSVFSKLILLAIGLISQHRSLKILAIVSYLINVIVAWQGFNYLGWLTAVQAIELIFVVWFLYPKDTFLKNDATDRFLFHYRLGKLAAIAGLTAVIYILFQIARLFWDGTFLEYGGNTAFIFGTQYFLYSMLQKIHLEEGAVIESRRNKVKQLAELRLAQQEMKGTAPEKTKPIPIVSDNFVKLAGIWLIVMDLSILSYIIKPNDVGFGFGAFFVLLSIIVSLIVKTEEDPNDVFSLIYHKIRPVQPVFFIILLIAHAQKFSYGAAYALLFAVAYFFWAIGKINMKTLLTATVLIYFFPVFGYISNPYRLGAESLSDVGKMLVKKGSPEYFNLTNWLDWSSDSFEEDYFEDDYTSGHYDKDSLTEQTRTYADAVWVSNYTSDAGIEIEEYVSELELSYNAIIDKVEVQVRTTNDLITLSGYQEAYDRAVAKPEGEDFPYQYRGYVYLQDIEGAYGTYRIYIKLDEQWLEKFAENPDDLSYDLLISGVDGDLSVIEIY